MKREVVRYKGHLMAKELETIENNVKPRREGDEAQAAIVEKAIDELWGYIKQLISC